MFLRKNMLVLTTQKKGLYEWKKQFEKFLRRKTSLEKTCLLFRQEYNEQCTHMGVYSAILSALV